MIYKLKDKIYKLWFDKNHETEGDYLFITDDIIITASISNNLKYILVSVKDGISKNFHLFLEDRFIWLRVVNCLTL